MLAPRVIPPPREPSASEKRDHEVTHTPFQPWCEFCVLGYAASKPHERLTFEQKDTAKAKVLTDYTYMKTNGEFTPMGAIQPEVAELFATTLLIVDRDTLVLKAISMPTKAVTDYAVEGDVHFTDRLNLERTELNSDNEPTILALKSKAKEKRKKPTDLTEGSLKDSQNMGSIEAPIRWWQALTRTLRFDVERRYAAKLTADQVLWCWLVRHAAWLIERYRVRADGMTPHYAAFGVGYRGEILPFAETALFKVPMNHTRQVSKNVTAHRGESTFVKGIWVGKHDESDDHLYLTDTGWHRARTVRRLELTKRADTVLLKKVKGAPWDARSAAPTQSRPSHVGGGGGAAEVRVPREHGEADLAPVPEAEGQAEGAGAAAPDPPAPAAQPGADGGLAEAPMAVDVNMERGQKREPDDSGEGRGLKVARTVEAVSLDEPLDLTLLDTLEGTTSVDHAGVTPAEALAGKRRALEMLKHYGVYETRLRSECTHMKPIRARWEPQYHGDTLKQWRYVAQEFKWMEHRDDVFAASSNAATSKMVDFVGLKEDGNVTFIADVVKAYYQAEQSEAVYVEPPKEFVMLMMEQGCYDDVVWELKRMLPGQRAAAAGWVAKAAKTLANEGFERCALQPQFFLHRVDKVLIEVHVDDFHGTGPPQASSKCITRLRELLDLKASDIIVQGRYSHLKRDRLRRGGAVYIRPDPRHIVNLLDTLGLPKLKAAVTPSLDGPDPVSSPITEEKELVSRFRRCVGLVLYIAADRQDIQRDVQLLSRK